MSQTTPLLQAPLYERDSLLREGWKELRSLGRYRELVGYLVRTSLRKENANLVLGHVWWLLDPLLLMATYVLLIQVILQRGGENFALFVLVAVLAWKHFSSCCGNAMGLTVGKETIMRQVNFPRVVLPLSAVVTGTVHLLFGLGMLVVVAAPFGIYPHPIVAVALLVVAVQVLLTLGLAYLLAAVNVFFRDVQPLTAYVFRIWFYLSPSLYAVTLIPDRYRPLYDLNPFATLLPAYRTILLDHELPDFGALALVAAFAVGLLGAGYLVFVRLQQSFTKVT